MNLYGYESIPYRIFHKMGYFVELMYYAGHTTKQILSNIVALLRIKDKN